MKSSLRFTLDQLPVHMREKARAQIAGASAQPAMVEKVVKPRKYFNRPVEIDGERFASQKEGRRWGELRLMEKAGEIRDLRRQVAYQLTVRGVEIAVYVADFVFRTAAGHKRCQDVKGYKRGMAYRIFRIKKALMKALHRIEVEEI